MMKLAIFVDTGWSLGQIYREVAQPSARNYLIGRFTILMVFLISTIAP